MATNRDDYPLVLDRDSPGWHASHNRLRSEYGIKGSGLRDLPGLWTPRFFLVSKRLYLQFQDITEYGQSLSMDMVIAGTEAQDLCTALRRIESNQDSWVIARSSAIDEDIDWRGRYKSEPCLAKTDDVLCAIGRVFESCPPEDTTEMGIVVQSYIRMRKASGHLSNERRVSRSVSSWVCEFDSVSGSGSASIQKMTSVGVESADENRELLCVDNGSLVQALKHIAAWACNRKRRIHFEWLWDGTRLWIVQADVIPEAPGHTPSATAWHGAPVAETGPLSVLISERTVPKDRWAKLDCVKVFRQCHLPTTDLWLLEDQATLAGLAKGQCSAELRNDIEVLLAAPIVIRTDVRHADDRSRFMLPRTHTLDSVDAVVEFLIVTSIRIAKECGETSSVCFIFHRFIPARSSAFGLAAPNQTRVKVDGIWGFPDGLLFYPHDSYDLTRDATGKIHKRVRYKREFLDTDVNGRWIPKRLGQPLDRKSSLEDDELREIAKGTYQVALAVDAPVQVMWFIGIPSGIGHPKCLPWFFDVVSPPREVVSQPPTLGGRDPIIRKPEDLELLRSEIEDTKSVSTIRLRPLPELLRSREFMESVAAFAQRLSLSVLIEGSVLSHAYYILRQCGVRVACADPFAPVFKRQKFDKLVRDKIPLRIQSRGEEVNVVRLQQHELTSVLRSKAVEEALELFWAETFEEMREEIADLLEVIRALCVHEHIEDSELKRLEEAKRENRGAFDRGFFLKETQEVPIIRLASETPSLFTETASPESQNESVVVHQKKGLNLGPIPHREGPTLVIPLVPPNPQNRYFGYTFDFRSAGVTLNIGFREKDIAVEVGPLREVEVGPLREVDPRQLLLFSDD